MLGCGFWVVVGGGIFGGLGVLGVGVYFWHGLGSLDEPWTVLASMPANCAMSMPSTQLATSRGGDDFVNEISGLKQVGICKLLI